MAEFSVTRPRLCNAFCFQGQSELGAASEDIQVQNLTTWQDLLRCQCSKAKLWRFFVRHTRDMWLLVFMGVLGDACSFCKTVQLGNVPDRSVA